MFAFLLLGRKIELIRAANHKGEHIPTSRALLNRGIQYQQGTKVMYSAVPLKICLISKNQINKWNSCSGL